MPPASSLGQVVGLVILGVAGGQHRFGVGAPVVRGDQDKRGVRYRVCETPWPGRSPPGRCRDMTTGGCTLSDHRFLVVRSIVQPRAFFGSSSKSSLPTPQSGHNQSSGHIFPPGARGNAVVRPAFLLVVNQATDNTFPSTHCRSISISGFWLHNRGAYVLTFGLRAAWQAVFGINFETQHYRPCTINVQGFSGSRQSCNLPP